MKAAITVVLSTVLATGTPLACAGEYFGEFSDDPVGKWVWGFERPQYQLQSGFSFSDPNGLIWSVPAGKEVDGASIPRMFWTFIGGPFEGNYIYASIIHDYFCDTKERTSHETHRAFYYGMRAKNVEEWRALAMYWAVQVFGPDWSIATKPKDQACVLQRDGSWVCTSGVPGWETTSIPSVAVDTSNEINKYVAMSKFNAIANSLRMSEGDILDVTSDGPIAATLDNIDSSAAQVKRNIIARNFVRDPKSIGILASPEILPAESVKGWVGNEVPQYDAAKQAESVKDIPRGVSEGFRLHP